MALTARLPVMEQPVTDFDSAAFSDSGALNSNWLHAVCLRAGADDVGFVDIDDPAVINERPDILSAFPRAKTLISFALRMNREPIRSPARSIANLEFHRTEDAVNDTARRIVTELETLGIQAINPAMGCPMEMDRFAERFGSCLTSPLLWLQDWAAWEFIGMSFIRSSAVSSC